MASADDVQLPDLQVIQRYSLAVRGATAPIADVVEALQSDLAWLTGGGRRRTAAPARKTGPTKAASAPKTSAAKKAPARKALAKKSPARKAPSKKAPAKRAGARR